MQSSTLHIAVEWYIGGRALEGLTLNSYHEHIDSLVGVGSFCQFGIIHHDVIGEPYRLVSRLSLKIASSSYMIIIRGRLMERPLAVTEKLQKLNLKRLTRPKRQYDWRPSMIDVPSIGYIVCAG